MKKSNVFLRKTNIFLFFKKAVDKQKRMCLNVLNILKKTLTENLPFHVSCREPAVGASRRRENGQSDS